MWQVPPFVGWERALCICWNCNLHGGVRDALRSLGVRSVAIPYNDRRSRVSRVLLRARTRVARVAPALPAMVLVLGACTAAETEQTNTTTTSPSSTPTQPPSPPQPDELEWERIIDGAATRQDVRQPEVDDATLNPMINDICPLPAAGAIGIGGHGVDRATPAMWLTEDRKTWKTAVVDGASFGGGFNTLNRCDADGRPRLMR